MNCDIHKDTELEWTSSRERKCPKCSQVIAKALEEEKKRVGIVTLARPFGYLCPIRGDASADVYCCKSLCAWWNEEERECCIKTIWKAQDIFRERRDQGS